MIYAANGTTSLSIHVGNGFFGIIKEIGCTESSFDYKKGNEVYEQASVTTGGSGAFAEIAFTDADNIALKPKTLSHEQAAALTLVGVTAWQALIENMSLSKDQKILVYGGAGGIGSIAIPLAKNLDANVATTVSSDDKEFVKNLGSDKVIDYKNQRFEELIHDYDVVYDSVGDQTYTKSFKVLNKGGIIVSMLEQPNSDLMQQFGVKAIF